MENALGEPQTILLLGGTSDIGLAIVRRLLSPTTRTVVLACRERRRASALRRACAHDSLTVDVCRLRRCGRRRRTSRYPSGRRPRYGDIDVAIVAFCTARRGSR